MPASNEVIGLIAGGRQFPVMVAEGVKREGHRLVVAGFTGHTNMDVVPLADVWKELKLGKLQKMIDFFKDNGTSKIIMAGTINKPKAMDVRHLDMRAIKAVFSQKGKGDASILGALTKELESEGIEVVPAHSFLPDLITPEGVLTKNKPTEREWEDLRYGWKVAKEMGKMDVGQCIVLREGIVAAVEALEGTDQTINRGCEYGGKGCVVVKVFKPGQQKHVDLPAIGVDTIKAMASGKAACLGIEAGNSLFFDRERALRAAAQSGIAVVGLSDENMK